MQHNPQYQTIMGSDTGPLIAKLAQTGSGETVLLQFLLENIPDRIYFKDRQSRFIRISRALANHVGLSSALEAVGKTDSDYFASHHAEAAFADEKQLMRTGEAIVGKVEKETLSNGEVRWALTTKMPLRNTRGEIVGTCGISKDFTAQKQMEDALAATNRELATRGELLEAALAELNEAHGNLKSMHHQLVEAEKMQAVGRLACGVAHEIRNPLGILQAGLDYLDNSPATHGDSPEAAIFAEMKAAIQRAETVVSALVESTSENALKLNESHDLHEIIEEVLTSPVLEWSRHQISLSRDFDAGIPLLKLDRGKIGQVLDGIFRNGIDAMPEGGELTVRTRMKRLDASEIDSNPGSRSNQRLRAGDQVVVIQIENSGPAISPEVLARVFDPFYTTKSTGAGTGLGLTVCRKIIELHGGSLGLENRAEGGVRVSLTLVK